MVEAAEDTEINGADTVEEGMVEVRMEDIASQVATTAIAVAGEMVEATGNATVMMTTIVEEVLKIRYFGKR